MSTTSNTLKTAVFTLLVPAVIVGAIPQSMVSGDHLHQAQGVFTRVIGWTLIALGAAGYLWCASLFVRAQGTPAPAFPTKETVVNGPYRINRNPMYTSVLTVVFGQAVLYTSWQLAEYGVFLAVGFHLFVLLYEERVLRARFNGDYEEFCRRVPRWIPRPKIGR